MKFDLDILEQSAATTFDVIVGHQPAPPDDEGRPVQGAAVGFKVLGPGSPEYTKAERAIQVMNVKEANTRKAPLDLKTDEGAEQVVEGGDARRDLVIMTCTVGWFGFEAGGQPAEFNRENLLRVLKARPNWARRLITAIENEANFGEA
jgi:hypothetical protein